MITIYYTEEFERLYTELPAQIQKKAERREMLFRQNPFYPSLQTEKLHPKNREIWSFRVDRNYRVLFKFENQTTIYFLAVGPHHWIYRYLN